MVGQSIIVTVSVLIGWIIGYMIGHLRCRTNYAAMYKSLLDLYKE